MKWRFDGRSAVLAGALLVLLVMLATLGAGLGWVRSFLGDVLAVVWVYGVLAMVVWMRPPWRPLLALSAGLAVELGQYLAMQGGWRVQSPVLRIVLGSTPDWLDVLAYLLGFALAWWAEKREAGNPPS